MGALWLKGSGLQLRVLDLEVASAARVGRDCGRVGSLEGGALSRGERG